VTTIFICVFWEIRDEFLWVLQGFSGKCHNEVVWRRMFLNSKNCGMRDVGGGVVFSSMWKTLSLQVNEDGVTDTRHMDKSHE